MTDNVVLKNFLKITKIPRPSGKEKQIADFLVLEAKKRGLEFFRDIHNNVVIKKPTKIENAKTIIFQAHSDMVCEKEVGKEFDFETSPIETYIEGDWIKAKGTTLGADNGVGMAMILSLLDENTENINVEAVFTATEETSMVGASKLDTSILNGRTMINLDGTEESVVECSCAGITCLEISSGVKKEFSMSPSFKVSIKNLAGGHSGSSIHEYRGNANKLIASFLKTINVKNIVSFNGGTKYNVIPSYASCEFVSNLNEDKIKKEFESYKHLLKKVFIDIDQNFSFKLEKTKQKSFVFSRKDTKRLLNFVCRFKNGVLIDDENFFPILSNNLAVVSAEDNVCIKVSIRSSSEKLLFKRLRRIKRNSRGYVFEIKDSSPMFEYNQNSQIRKIMVETHKKLFGFYPEVKKIHACMEGGVFSSKIQNLDIAIIASEIRDIHSIAEMANIPSMQKTFSWLLEIVKSL